MARRLPSQKLKRFRLRHSKKRALVRALAVLVFAVIGSVLIYYSFAAPGEDGGDDYPSYIAPNPTVVSQSCLGGLNIAMLADVSGSITRDDQAFSEMHTALKDFVSSLLPSTHALFSLTEFDDNATVLQNFTNNVSALDTAIDSLAGGDGTNWTAGLQAAYGTLSSVHSNVPGLLIIATDGDPTQPQNPLSSAADVANTIKGANIHILALGLGDNPTVSNLEAISGPKVNTGGVNSDVITTDFSTMSAALQNIASSTCSSGSGTGGTGTGTGGNGTGTGGTGNGSGIGGTGTGNNGTGTGLFGSGRGTVGKGTGTTGSGTGVTVGTHPQPSPTPVPTATQGVQPSPTPTLMPSPQPTPAPAAMPTPQPQPTPAPTPTAQGTRTKPPAPKPSPFFDGKQFAAGSAPDNDNTIISPHSTRFWLYAGIAGGAILAAGGLLLWRKHIKASLLPRKPQK